MRKLSFLIAAALLIAVAVPIASQTKFNTQWITSKPEMSTYKTSGKEGNGLYQMTVSGSDSVIEIYLNIVSPGFTKTIFAQMTRDMKPQFTKSRIYVNGGVIMETESAYWKDSLSISTLIRPYNVTRGDKFAYSGLVIDFSQIPLLVRTLQLNQGDKYEFQSLNPKTNGLSPYTVKVIGEEKAGGVDCIKLEAEDFEGKALIWIDKATPRTIIKIEQPTAERVSELIN